MKCSKCRKLMVEFSEGRLEGELDQEIREHIMGCAVCRKEINDLRSSLELIGAVKNIERIPEPPADFADRVMAQIRRGTNSLFDRPPRTRGVEREPHFSFRRLTFGVAAVCCLLILGTAIFFRFGFSNRQDPALVSDGTASTARSEQIYDGSFFSSYSATRDSNEMPALLEKAYIGMEVARLLRQTLEIIERGEQKWEVEI